MKKIYITIIVAILLAGGITALSFSLDKKNFTEEVTTIDSKGVCEKFYDEDKDKDKIKFKKCKDKNYELDIANSPIEIKQDPSTGWNIIQAR